MTWHFCSEIVAHLYVRTFWTQPLAGISEVNLGSESQMRERAEGILRHSSMKSWIFLLKFAPIIAEDASDILVTSEWGFGGDSPKFSKILFSFANPQCSVADSCRFSYGSTVNIINGDYIGIFEDSWTVFPNFLAPSPLPRAARRPSPKKVPIEYTWLLKTDWLTSRGIRSKEFVTIQLERQSTETKLGRKRKKKKRKKKECEKDKQRRKRKGEEEKKREKKTKEKRTKMWKKGTRGHRK